MKTTDILVVGGGITGLSTAYHLRDSGKNITLVDKGNSATAKSAGIITDAIELDASELIQRKGGNLLIQYVRNGIKGMLQSIKKERIECSLEKRGSLYVATRPSAMKTMKKEYHAMKDVLNDPVEILDARGMQERICLPQIYGGLWYPNTYTLQPAELRKGLLNCLKKDVEMKEGNVIAISKDKALLQDGERIHFGKAILCNSFDAYRLCKLRAPIFYIKTYLGITQKLTPEQRQMIRLKKEVFWTSDRPSYTYGRIEGGKLVIAGRDQIIPRKNTLHDPGKDEKGAIEYLLSKQFPFLSGIPMTEARSGVMDFTLDQLPLVGEVEKNIYTGLCTTGLPFGFANGRLLSQLVQGNVPQEYQLLRWDRPFSPLASLFKAFNYLPWKINLPAW